MQNQERNVSNYGYKAWCWNYEADYASKIMMYNVPIKWLQLVIPKVCYSEGIVIPKVRYSEVAIVLK